jgi:hypothetical protein
MALNPKHFSARDRFASLNARYIPDGGSDPDSVMVEPPKYKADDFLVPAADTAGRSARAQCRIPPIIAREIQEIIHQRRFPFRTDSDVVRWCIMYGLDALSQMEPSPGFLQRAIAEMEVLKDDEIWARQREVIQTLEASVKRYTDMNQWVEARRLVLDALARFRSGYEEKWREMILEQIKNKFQHVLEYGDRRAPLP